MHKVIAFGLFIFLCGCGQQSSAPPASAPDEHAAIAALGDINQAQKDYFRRTRRYALEYDELIAQHLLPGEPHAPGYRIQMKPKPDAASYTVSAVPIDPSAAVRHLFTDQTGVVRAEQGKDATADSPAI